MFVWTKCRAVEAVRDTPFVTGKSMHEMSLAEGVLQLVEETARRENARRVKTVVLEIGQLSTVEPAALEFCFAAVAAQGVAGAARLVIIAVPGTGRCMECGLAQPMAELFGVCPECGSHRLQPTGGSEMRVREIEIE